MKKYILISACKQKRLIVYLMSLRWMWPKFSQEAGSNLQHGMY